MPAPRYRVAVDGPGSLGGGSPLAERRSQHRWLAAQIALIVVALAATAFFTLTAPSGVSLVKRFTPTTLGDQPPGAVVLGREDGRLAVGLAVAPRAHGVLVMATVFSQAGTGKTGLRPHVTITNHDGSQASASATACTAGCYEALLPGQGLPRSASISFANGSHLHFDLPAHGPSVQGLELVSQAAAEYKQIHSMVTHERLGSSPHPVVATTYYAVAPHSLRYDVHGEGETIIIGHKSWSRSGTGPWQESPQTALITPIGPYWTPLVKDATILGSATVRSRPVWVISFADPQTPGFFTIWVDKQTHRTLQLKMTAAAHFMHHGYDGFNSPFSVEPPPSR